MAKSSNKKKKTNKKLKVNSAPETTVKRVDDAKKQQSKSKSGEKKIDDKNVQSKKKSKSYKVKVEDKSPNLEIIPTQIKKSEHQEKTKKQKIKVTIQLPDDEPKTTLRAIEPMIAIQQTESAMDKTKANAKPVEHHSKSKAEPRNIDRPRIRTWRYILAVILRIAIIAVAAIGITWFLQFRYNMNGLDKTWGFVFEHPLTWWYSCLLVFFLTLAISGLWRGAFTGPAITFSLVIIIGFIETSKFSLRGAPIYPEDFQMAGETASLINFVNIWGIVKMLMAIALVIVLAIVLNHLTRGVLYWRKKSMPNRWWKRSLIIPRALMIAGGIVGFIVFSHPILYHSGNKDETISQIDAYFEAWNQSGNYQRNGFLLGFLYNLKRNDATTEPVGYDESAVKSIAEKYERIAKKEDADVKDDDELATRTSLKNEDYNIVIVLNESFYDVDLLREFYNYEGEVTPNLREIMANNPSGYMYSTDYGGGTANIEFEVLTGLSNYWSDTVPYTNILPKLERVPSVASFAKENGYHTVAVHPYSGSVYKRDLVLPKLGIDEFITQLEMKHTDKDPHSDYINDKAAYNEVLDLINNRGEKQLIELITMQNHAPYSLEGWEDFEVFLDNQDDFSMLDATLIASYFHTLRASDKYLGEFIKALEKMDEKTVVLFYGDHAPGVFEGALTDGRYDEAIHETPYFIYANFELPGIETEEDVEYSYQWNNTIGRYMLVKQTVEKMEMLPITTPNCLANTLFNALYVDKPTLGYILDEVCVENPILTREYSDATITVALKDYEMVNYDILSGEQYWLKYAKN